MKILFASSEIHPLIKTGGLADVSAGLPQALCAEGVDVRLVMPAYPEALIKVGSVELVAQFSLPGCPQQVRIFQSVLPGTQVPLFLVDANYFFNRPGGPYGGPDGRDWPDNAQRFTVFCRSIVELAMKRVGLDWYPDLVHCNDWQTGLVPALLQQEQASPATLFTIHNLAYQGLFPWEDFIALGLPMELWSEEGMEFYNKFSFIKGGLVYADAISTVSPTYAKEIQTPQFGCGLEGMLQFRQSDLHGIINGADNSVWNPQTDPHIAAHYSASDLGGKQKCKVALQRRLDLPQKSGVPIIAHIGRVVEQKGIDLIIESLPTILKQELQVVILGSGDKRLENDLLQLAKKNPEKMSVTIGYDERLSHQIEAGADIFLMPSRFEPCGLNQIYSMRYGTLPIVSNTGGLADTVVDSTDAHVESGRATGFVLPKVSSKSLLGSIDRALDIYFKNPQGWLGIVKSAMGKDFEWKKSALKYRDLYAQLIG